MVAPVFFILPYFALMLILEPLIKDLVESAMVYPGEWICRLDEVSRWFRTRFQYQAIDHRFLLDMQKIAENVLL